MIRKQVYIEQAQEVFLKRQAHDLGVTEAELIRRAIEQLRHSPARRRFDHEAWQDVLAFLRQRAGLQAGASATPWHRDDAYEERLVRFPR